MDECRQIMTGFGSTQVAHCPREGNKAAHIMAQARNLDINIWLEEPPMFLVPQLVEDIILID